MLEEDLRKVKGLLDRWEALAEENKIEEAQKCAIEALSLLESYRETYGDDRKIWTFIGETYNYYYPLKDHTENKRNAKQAYLKAFGKDICLFKHLAEAYGGLGSELGPTIKNLDAMKAVALSSIYIEVFPDDYEEWANLGSHYSYIDDLENAEECYLKALEINPNFSRALSRLAHIYREQLDYEKALQMLKRDAELQPESHHPWTRMAEIQFELATGGTYHVIKPQSLDKAINLMKKAVKRLPDSWSLRQKLALYYWLRGDLEKAVDNSRKAEELKKKSEEDLNKLGLII